MTDDHTIAIVGGGLAGAQAAEGARAAGHEGRLVLIGAEPELPYERPPLSKAVLRGDAGAASTRVHDPGFYAEHDIELLTGRTVAALDPNGRRLRFDDGESLPYRRVILATGAEPRRLDVEGATLDGVHHLRTLDDARRLGEALTSAARVAVVGAGWIGSEVAASARQLGPEVVLIDPGPAPLARVLGDRVSAVFSSLHADHGVRLRMQTSVVGLRGTNRVESVVLADGSEEPADVVVVGVGVLPRVDLAVAAGLPVDNGIVVDELLESPVPGVFAAGDVAAAWHPQYRRHLRVEHWANALNQGTTAGRNAAGEQERYHRLPYFFSDQYDLGLEYVGHAAPGDAVVVHGDLASREFLAFWQHDGIVTAAMAVNVWGVIEDLKTIVGGPTHRPRQQPRWSLHLAAHQLLLDRLLGHLILVSRRGPAPAAGGVREPPEPVEDPGGLETAGTVPRVELQRLRLLV
ncbi:MAG TPA: FAD-dependent oxidoreductase [Acidimicrobiales bacterium]|nr:FAD-dependent oxidoreductase [Acidimicrobiales bacterium]